MEKRKRGTAREPFADDLEFYFQDFGGQIGFCSNFGDMTEKMARLTFGGKRSTCQTVNELGEEIGRDDAQRGDVQISHTNVRHNDPFARLVEPETIRDIKRAKRVYRLLKAVVDAGVTSFPRMAYRQFGPRPPGDTCDDVFGAGHLHLVLDTWDSDRVAMANELADEQIRRWDIPPDDETKKRRARASVRTHALRQVRTGDAVRRFANKVRSMGPGAVREMREASRAEREAAFAEAVPRRREAR